MKHFLYPSSTGYSEQQYAAVELPVFESESPITDDILYSGPRCKSVSSLAVLFDGGSMQSEGAVMVH